MFGVEGDDSATSSDDDGMPSSDTQDLAFTNLEGTEDDDVEELVKLFWEYHNSEKFEILNEDLYFMCQKYFNRHKKFLTKSRKKAQRRANRHQKVYYTTMRERIRDYLEKPESSRAARRVAFLLFLLIIGSTVTFLLEGLPRYNPDIFPAWRSTWQVVEAFFTGAFTIEVILRLAVADHWILRPDDDDDIDIPARLEEGQTVDEILREYEEKKEAAASKKEKQITPFFLSPFNWIDILAIVPFYLELALGSGGTAGLRVIRLIRIIRVFRVLKIARRSGTNAAILKEVLQLSLPAIIIPGFFLFTGLMVVSTLVFYAERGAYDAPNQAFLIQNADCESRPAFLSGIMECRKLVSKFRSVPDTLWWGVVTLTTVGYGDIVPQTRLGKFFASFGMFVGIVFLAMPLAIVGGNFAKVVNQHVERKQGARRAQLEKQFRHSAREMEVQARHEEIDLPPLDRRLEELGGGLRGLLPALQVCHPKLYRHVDHFLEFAKDIRAHAQDEVLLRNIERHNESVRKEAGKRTRY